MQKALEKSRAIPLLAYDKGENLPNDDLDSPGSTTFICLSLRVVQLSRSFFCSPMFRNHAVASYSRARRLTNNLHTLTDDVRPSLRSTDVNIITDQLTVKKPQRLFRSCWSPSYSRYSSLLWNPKFRCRSKGSWRRRAIINLSNTRFPLVRSRLVSLEFFIDIKFSNRTMALGSTQPLTEMSTRSISWG